MTAALTVTALWELVAEAATMGEARGMVNFNLVTILILILIFIFNLTHTLTMFSVKH